jgi:hypothetical protein
MQQMWSPLNGYYAATATSQANCAAAANDIKTITAASHSGDDLSANVSRKRRLDSVDDVALNASATPTAMLPTVVPTMKRPALVDSKTGLPVYQPLPAAPACYNQQMALPAVTLQPHTRYITLPVAGCPTVLPPF